MNSWYFKLITVPSFCPLTLISLWMPLALFAFSLVLPVLISILHIAQIFEDFKPELLVPSLSQQSVKVIGTPQITYSSAIHANLSVMFFQSIRHNPFIKKDMLNWVGMRRRTLVRKHSAMLPFIWTILVSLIIEVLNGAK